QREFGIALDSESRSNGIDDARQVLGRHTRWRAATEVNRVDFFADASHRDFSHQRDGISVLHPIVGADDERAVRAMHAAERKVNVEAEHRSWQSLFLYNCRMPAVVPEPRARRPRLIWTLVGAMALVALVPLGVSHYSLIRINRDSLETLEKKYLTR